jgi:glucans biosynthesis protein
MDGLSRRSFLLSSAAVAGVLPLPAGAIVAQAQQGGRPQPPRFAFENVIERARDLAARPYDATVPPLPAPLAGLDFDRWREFRFRPERAFLANRGPFRLQLFHLGFLFTRPVTVNIIRDGIAAPIPYAANLFDTGRTRIERPLPVDTGFAGFRLHYPLNDPRVLDELISFVGASYFRFLGRGHRYGLSARGLAIGVGAKETEEFPYFREFWIDQPEAAPERATIYALMDGVSVTGAYRFHVYPAPETVVDVAVTLFPRRPIPRIGLAPLTSMFFSGENDRRFKDDFRPEVHDSDGLLVHTGAGEWLWRPLRNPAATEMSAFVDNNVRGFGLMQRDRVFEHYQDLDLHYELRPSYWIEPVGQWGEGQVELTEIPTGDETNDNIVAYWSPKAVPEPGREITLGYRIRAISNEDALHPGGKAINTYQTRARALGSAEPEEPGSRRFIVDFAGGDLAHYLSAPDLVEIVPSVSTGRITRTFLVPNPQTKGFRAGIDVVAEPGKVAHIRAFLRSGGRALTETWTYPWTTA